MQSKTLWRMVLVLLCALVFLFVLHAKTAVYNAGAPVKATPSTASKLWISGEKAQVPPVVDLSGGALAWMAVMCLYALHLHREPRVQSALLLPPASHASLRHLRRFLRPPPSQV